MKWKVDAGDWYKLGYYLALVVIAFVAILIASTILSFIVQIISKIL